MLTMCNTMLTWHIGIVVQHTERILPPKRRATGDETENQMEQEGPVKVLEQQATFD